MRYEHGAAAAGKKTKTYKIWCGMKSRCANENQTPFKNYGGRGIRVCQEWSDSFAAFLSYMGECPDGYSIERKDNDRGYEPGNCAWIPRASQSANRRSVVMVEADGLRLSVAEWSRRSGINIKTICTRIANGWPPDEAVLCQLVRIRRGVKRGQSLRSLGAQQNVKFRAPQPEQLEPTP